METFRKINIITYTFLVIIILASISNWKPREDQTEAHIRELKVSREEALTIVKTNVKVDPEKNIVKDEWLRSAELQCTSIDWSYYPRALGHHRRIYVSTTPVGDIAPYWFIDYQSPGFLHNYTYGSYVVDATTGELMLVLEGAGGPWHCADFLTSFTPAYADDPYFPVEIKEGQSREVIVGCTAQPSYDASLPLFIRVTSVPKRFVVTQNATSGILRTGGAFAIKLVIESSADAPGFNPPPYDSARPRVGIEIGFLGVRYSESVYVKLVP